MPATQQQDVPDALIDQVDALLPKRSGKTDTGVRLSDAELAAQEPARRAERVKRGFTGRTREDDPYLTDLDGKKTRRLSEIKPAEIDALAGQLEQLFPVRETTAGEKIAVGVAGGIASAAKVPEMAGKFAEFIGVPKGLIERHVPQLKALADYGRRLEQASNEAEDPRFADQSLGAQALRGAGSMLPMAAAMPIGAGLGEMAAEAVPGAMGLLGPAGRLAGSMAGAVALGQTSVPMMEDVLHATGDPKKAWKAAFIGMALDATEVEGLGEIFGGLDEPVQHTLRKALGKIAMGSAEEGAQEFYSQLGQEISTGALKGEKLKKLDTLVSSGRAGLVGAILGGTIGGTHTLGAALVGRAAGGEGGAGPGTTENTGEAAPAAPARAAGSGELSFPADRAAAPISDEIKLPFGSTGKPAAAVEQGAPKESAASPETAAAGEPPHETAAKAILEGKPLKLEELTPEAIQKAVELKHTPSATGPALGEGQPSTKEAVQAPAGTAKAEGVSTEGSPRGYAHTEEPATNSSVQPGDKLGPVKPTPIADLTEFNPNKKPEARKVSEIVEAMSRGDKLPPVIASRGEGGKLVIDDGSHRIAAAKELGYTHVPVRIVEGKESVATAKEPEPPRMRTADVVNSLREIVHELENQAEDTGDEELPAILQRADRVITQRKASGQNLTELDDALSELVSSARMGPGEIGSEDERKQSEHTLFRLRRARRMLDVFDATRQANTPARRVGEQANPPATPESSPAVERPAAPESDLGGGPKQAAGSQEETGPQYVRRTIAERLAKAEADLAASEADKRTPSERVKKMGGKWWAETLGGGEIPSPFKTKAAATAFLSKGDANLIESRRALVERERASLASEDALQGRIEKAAPAKGINSAEAKAKRAAKKTAETPAQIIDRLTATGEARQKQGSDTMRGLRPAPIDWLDSAEKAQLHEAQLAMPREKSREQAQADVARKRAERLAAAAPGEKPAEAQAAEEPVQEETAGPDKPEPKPTAETSLREFIRSAGGLRFVGDVENLTRLEAGETKLISRRDKRSGKSVTVRVNTRAQPIVHNKGVAKGMSLDEATEAAWEAGFFHERPDINELIDALEADKRHPSAEVREPSDTERARAEAQQKLWDAAMDSGDLGTIELLAFPGGMFPDLAEHAKKLAAALAYKLGYVRRQKLFTSAVIPTETGTELAIRKWADSFRGVKTLQQALAQKGGTVTDATDAYLQEELRRGKSKARIDALRAEHIEPILVGLRRDGISPEEAGEVLMARAAEDRNALILARDPENAAGSGFTNEEARAIVDRALSGKRKDGFLRLFDRFDKLIASTRQGWVRDNLMSQADVDELEKAQPVYAPMRSDLDDQAEASAYRGTGRGIDVRGNEFRSATGRHTKAEAANVLAYAFTSAEQGIVRGEKNRVALSFLNLLRSNEELTRGFAKINPPQTQRAVVNGVVRKVYDPTFRNAPNAILVHEDGEHVWIEIDPKYQNVADGLKNLGAENAGKLVKWGGSITRKLAAVNTRYNPVFPLFNALRDASAALINSSEHGIGFATRTVRDVPLAIAALAGREGGKFSDYVREYRESGAPVSFLDLASLEDSLKRVEKFAGAKARAGTKGGILRSTQAVLDVIDHANDIVENATRFSGYVHAREDLGMSQDRAASWAKNLTTNFERKGDNGATVNALYMFANAGIQSTARIGQALKSPAVRRLLGAAMVGMMGWDQVMRALGGKDADGEDCWDKIPAHIKRHNLVFVYPGSDNGCGRMVTIPAPFTYDLLQTVAQQFSGVMSGDIQPGAAFGEMMSAGVEAFDPIGSGNVDLSDPKSIARGISPTVLDPIVELATNRDWKGDEIVYDTFGHGADSAAKWPAPSRASAAVTSWLNRATGGDEFKGGSIDISPQTLDYLASFVAGGLGRTLSQAMDMSDKLNAGERVAPRDIPFVSRLVREPSPFASAQDFKTLHEAVAVERDRAKRDKTLLSPELFGLWKEGNRLDQDRQDARKAQAAMMPDQRDADVRAWDKRLQNYNRRARKALLTTP